MFTCIFNIIICIFTCIFTLMLTQHTYTPGLSSHHRRAAGKKNDTYNN